MERTETVKEIKANIEGLDFPVRGKIEKITTGDNETIYIGKLSHFCKPTEVAATIYIPSLTGSNIVTVEHLLKSYLKSFTLIDVTVNEHY